MLKLLLKYLLTKLLLAIQKVLLQGFFVIRKVAILAGFRLFYLKLQADLDSKIAFIQIAHIHLRVAVELRCQQDQLVFMALQHCWLSQVTHRCGIEDCLEWLVLSHSYSKSTFKSRHGHPTPKIGNQVNDFSGRRKCHHLRRVLAEFTSLVEI